MAICRCKSARCSCLLVGAAGVEVSGIGTARNPYYLDASVLGLIGISTDSASVTVTGDGSPGDPYEVSIDAVTSVQRTVFFESGSWTKPPGLTVAHIVVIGGGGGGGPGGGNSDVGGGGAGGSMSTAWVPLALLPSSVYVGVGSGGLSGQAGEESFFGNGIPMLMASGGGAGQRLGQVYGSYPAAVAEYGGTLHEGGTGGSGATRDAASGAPNAVPPMMDRIAPTGGGLGGTPTAARTVGGVRYPAPSTALWAGLGGDGGVSGAGGMPGGQFGGGGGGGGNGSGTFLGGAGGSGVVIVTCW